jgi:hypothetical protein
MDILQASPRFLLLPGNYMPDLYGYATGFSSLFAPSWKLPALTFVDILQASPCNYVCFKFNQQSQSTLINEQLAIVRPWQKVFAFFSCHDSFDPSHIYSSNLSSTDALDSVLQAFNSSLHHCCAILFLLQTTPAHHRDYNNSHHTLSFCVRVNAGQNAASS